MTNLTMRPGLLLVLAAFERHYTILMQLGEMFAHMAIRVAGNRRPEKAMGLSNRWTCSCNQISPPIRITTFICYANSPNAFNVGNSGSIRFRPNSFIESRWISARERTCDPQVSAPPRDYTAPAGLKVHQ